MKAGPVFAEPWQAQSFALAVRLSAQGHFTWKEWAATLAYELQVAVERGESDDGSRYYHCWPTALERLVVTMQTFPFLTRIGNVSESQKRLISHWTNLCASITSCVCPFCSWELHWAPGIAMKLAKQRIASLQRRS
jgi:nitrile hydratase accessory protein